MRPKSPQRTLAVLLLLALGSASCIVPVRSGYHSRHRHHRHRGPHYSAPAYCPPAITSSNAISPRALQGY